MLYVAEVAAVFVINKEFIKVVVSAGVVYKVLDVVVAAPLNKGLKISAMILLYQRPSIAKVLADVALASTTAIEASSEFSRVEIEFATSVDSGLLVSSSSIAD